MMCALLVAGADFDVGVEVEAEIGEGFWIGLEAVAEVGQGSWAGAEEGTGVGALAEFEVGTG